MFFPVCTKTLLVLGVTSDREARAIKLGEFFESECLSACLPRHGASWRRQSMSGRLPCGLS